MMMMVLNMDYFDVKIERIVGDLRGGIGADR